MSFYGPLLYYLPGLPDIEPAHVILPLLPRLYTLQENSWPAFSHTPLGKIPDGIERQKPGIAGAQRP